MKQENFWKIVVTALFLAVVYNFCQQKIKHDIDRSESTKRLDHIDSVQTAIQVMHEQILTDRTLIVDKQMELDYALSKAIRMNTALIGFKNKPVSAMQRIPNQEVDSIYNELKNRLK